MLVDEVEEFVSNNSLSMLLFKKKSSRDLKTVPSSKSDSHQTTIEAERRRALPNQSFQSKTYALGTILPEESVAPLSEKKANSNDSKSEITNLSNEKKLKKSIEELKKRYEKQFKELTALMVEKAEESVKLHSSIKEREKQVKLLKQENETLKIENEKLKKVCLSLLFFHFLADASPLSNKCLFLL
jgi:predicted  nucleic acid-binding Zn-ribbon protein